MLQIACTCEYTQYRCRRRRHRRQFGVRVCAHIRIPHHTLHISIVKCTSEYIYFIFSQVVVPVAFYYIDTHTHSVHILCVRCINFMCRVFFCSLRYMPIIIFFSLNAVCAHFFAFNRSFFYCWKKKSQTVERESTLMMMKNDDDDDHFVYVCLFFSIL